MTKTLVQGPINNRSFFLGGRDEDGEPKGRATFTVEVPSEFAAKYGAKPHYTYQIVYQPAKGTYHENWFVMLLAGSDNTSDYKYLGIFEPPHVRLTARSAFDHKSWPVKIIKRVIAAYWEGRQNEITKNGWNIHHEGRCCVCSRPLTTPTSVQKGIGPKCASRKWGTVV